MSSTKATGHLTPIEHLPDDIPKPQLLEDQHLELYQQGPARAVIIVQEKSSDVVVWAHWLESQDAQLCHGLLSAIQDRHVHNPGAVHFKIPGSNQALIAAVSESQPVRSQIMTRPVDSAAALPQGITYQPMTPAIGAAYLAEVSAEFQQTMRDNRPGASAEEVTREVAEILARVVPQGIETPDHAFLAIYSDVEGDDPVARLWVRHDKEKDESFCYKVDVFPEKRRKGYGGKTMAAWEAFAAASGVGSLRLNVFGNNEAGKQLYRSSGFDLQEALFTLEGGAPQAS